MWTRTRSSFVGGAVMLAIAMTGCASTQSGEGSGESAGDTVQTPTPTPAVTQVSLDEETGLVAPEIQIDLPSGWEEKGQPPRGHVGYWNEESACTVTVGTIPDARFTEGSDASRTEKSVASAIESRNLFGEQVTAEGEAWIPAPRNQSVEFAQLQTEYVFGAEEWTASQLVRVIVEPLSGEPGPEDPNGIETEVVIAYSCPVGNEAVAEEILSTARLIEGHVAEDDADEQWFQELRQSQG